MNTNPFLAVITTPSTSFIYTLKWIVMLTLVCVAYIIGYRMGYAPVLTVPARTYEVTLEKVVEKTIFVEKVIEKQTVKWKKSKEIKPDGTIKETEEVTDSLQKALITSSETLSVKEIMKAREEVHQSNETTWGVSAGRSVNQVNSYSVSRRMLGDLWLELEVNTTKDIGLNVRYEW